MMMLNTIMLAMLFNVITVTHPITLSMFLIAYSIVIGYIVAWLSMMWFSYLLIIVFLGGVMVLIIYMSAMSSNEKFNNLFYVNISHASMLMIMATVPAVLFFNTCKINHNSGYVTPLYSHSNLSMTILLFVYLLITMIVVVKLVKFEKGPLVKRL